MQAIDYSYNRVSLMLRVSSRGVTTKTSLREALRVLMVSKPGPCCDASVSVCRSSCVQRRTLLLLELLCCPRHRLTLNAILLFKKSWKGKQNYFALTGKVQVYTAQDCRSVWLVFCFWLANSRAKLMSGLLLSRMREIRYWLFSV